MRTSQTSTGYWDIVRDSLSDLVRVQMWKCHDQQGHKELYDHCRDAAGDEKWMVAFPNLFITIAPAEWKFPLPYWLRPYRENLVSGAYCIGIHMYLLVLSMWAFLCNRLGHRWFQVMEYAVRTEYQGRGTPHWHICAWVLTATGVSLAALAGRVGVSGQALAAAVGFVKFLGLLFMCEIDVQVGNGRLNYINGYCTKGHDAVDVGLGEYVQTKNTAPWLATFGLLSKMTPSIPECAIRLAQYSEFDKSYSHELLFPPQPDAVASALDAPQEHGAGGHSGNFSWNMYAAYHREVLDHSTSNQPVMQSFLQWHRHYRWDRKNFKAEVRKGKNISHGRPPTMVCACRYWYELTDGYWGQMALTQIPHRSPRDLLPHPEQPHLDNMKNFFGLLAYLRTWRFCRYDREARPGFVIRSGDFEFLESALPLDIQDSGALVLIGASTGTRPAPDADLSSAPYVFPTDKHAFQWMVDICSRDLSYRGFREDRVKTFVMYAQAELLLYRRVLECAADPAEVTRLKDEWERVRRPPRKVCQWSKQQADVLKIVEQKTSIDDQIDKEKDGRPGRFLYVAGAPGSGKSAVLLEAALAAAGRGLGVVIVCPTGQLVHSFKSQLPEADHVENIRVDTIHGVLNYKRPDKDGKVRWSPPSALRKIDLILVDEGSQYADTEFERFFKILCEQPHSPFCMIVADFQQLSPVRMGERVTYAHEPSFCQRLCRCCPSVTLDTVYRSQDPEHLLFLNHIRENQPTTDMLQDYFHRRQFRGTLEQTVGHTLDFEKNGGSPMTWLTCTNAGAQAVAQAALRYNGITQEELQAGFRADPASKCSIPILAKKGLVIRLTRNLDKTRGFVNGAVAEIVESLDGNAVFVARLRGTGNLVLVYPLYEDKQWFLPCCYGYATTIRKAQGASIDSGVLWFNNKRFAAVRGYAYVGVSRFRSKSGLFLFGKLRRSDFLPVGGQGGEEQVARGIASQDTDSDDSNYEPGHLPSVDSQDSESEPLCDSEGASLPGAPGADGADEDMSGASVAVSSSDRSGTRSGQHPSEIECLLGCSDSSCDSSGCSAQGASEVAYLLGRSDSSSDKSDDDQLCEDVQLPDAIPGGQPHDDRLPGDVPPDVIP